MSAEPAAETLREVREASGVDLAFDRLEELLDQAFALAPRAVAALVIFVVTWQIARLFTWMDWPYRWASNSFARESARKAVRLAFFFLGLLLALEILEITALVGAVLGTAGVVGIVLGFAFRDLVENYLAGLLLSLRQPFLPNELVDIDGQQGRVIRLTSRATVLLTLAGNHVRIPNSTVFKSVIVNYSRNPMRRFDFAVGVGTNEDLIAAQELGRSILAELEAVADDPAPSSAVEELGDSTVALRFFGWVSQDEHDFLKTRSEAIRRVKTAFDDSDIEMPEPIYRVHLTQVEASAPARKSRRTEADVDTSVDRHIEEQVQRERAREGDLLDDSTPVE